MCALKPFKRNRRVLVLLYDAAATKSLVSRDTNIITLWAPTITIMIIIILWIF